MRRMGTALLGTVLLLGFLHEAHAAKVRTETEEGVDLAAYGTFAWSKTSAILRPEAHQALLDASTEVLRSKGMRDVPEAEAEIVLSYKVLAANRENLQAFGYADPDKWGSAAYGGTDVQGYIEGQLAVYAEERATGKLLWTGEGEATVKDAAAAPKKIRKLAERLFRGWPRPR